MNEFEQIINQDCSTLEDLYSIWKTAHKVDPFWQENSVYTDEKAVNNYRLDGLVTTKSPVVLFILKESNDSTIGETGFWFKKVFDINNNLSNETLSGHEKRSATRYYKCIFEILKKLKEGDEKEKDYGIAYININKLGGISSSNNKKIENYAKQYDKLITKQIDLINPDIIFLMFSVNVLPNFANRIASRYKNKTIYKSYHPSGRTSYDTFRDFEKNKY